MGDLRDEEKQSSKPDYIVTFAKDVYTFFRKCTKITLKFYSNIGLLTYKSAVRLNSSPNN